MNTLKTARQNYPRDTEFISATSNLKIPQRVTRLRYAKHEDRKNRIKNCEIIIMTLYNERIYPKAVQKYEEVLFNDYSFLEEVKQYREEREFLLSIPRDIVEEEGGVIYCGETDTWAKN